MSANYLNIYPQRHPNTDYDASASAVIRKRDGARIKLNPSALVIWQLCDGTQSIEDINESICGTYELEWEDAMETIVPLLQYLHDQQCLHFCERRQGFRAPIVPPVVNFYPLPAELLEILEDYRQLCEPWFPKHGAGDDAILSEAKLAQKIQQPVTQANDNQAFREMKLVNNPDLKKRIEAVCDHISQLVSVKRARLVNTGHALYGACGSMGWHTNEDQPGLRIYCTWAEKANANYFRYRDPDNGEIVTLDEPAGWMVKSFYIPPRPRQLWHCLYAGSRRIAIGFAEFEFQRTDQIIEK